MLRPARQQDVIHSDLKLSGGEVCYLIFLISLVKTVLCSNLLCQKVSN